MEMSVFCTLITLKVRATGFYVDPVAGSYPGKGDTPQRETSMTKKSYHINFIHLLLSTNSQDVYLHLSDQLHSHFPSMFASQHPLEEQTCTGH